jgi:inhibitor of cysteine peptidase
VVALQGNPSTGYSWTLNEAASEHLEIVKIEDLGYSSPPPQSEGEPPVVGAPQEQRFRVTGNAAGTASLAFDYARPWEGKAVETEVVRMKVRE